MSDHGTHGGHAPHGPRQLLGPAFPDDTGAQDPRLAAALSAYAAGTGERVAVLAALVGTRLLVPVVAVLGEVEVGEDGLAREKSSDMAAVLMTTPDGRRGLLAFTGTEPLRTWNPEARPVPVTAQAAAQSAIQEEASALVIDLAGPVRLVVEGNDLRAVAHGWRPAVVDGEPVWLAPAPETDAGSDSPQPD
ncbi:SseB family protein [Nocardioides sp. dk4132]|uniref:SseB family protein n=1 Tax=unclassified Nocardioides TaxID=2615069 RepID=UPI0012973FE9|nr:MULTISPECIES: SseB family protein [unclassified Nocardioides]MQW76231.1 SseB family protein [Nocardioides sp. dk4132]QGA07478.1 SseB family protein [Nocardioides sp. dk884]